MTTAAFKRTVRAYYRAHGRSFPWRETNDAYAIYVSEMMLQQTQTERVLPKYREWHERFPDCAACAASPLPAVIACWNGLGYNRRARYLHETCKKIVTEFSGVFPDDVPTLETLPGIGPYTARAIATFAFNKPEIFIETNIRSVFIHSFFSDSDVPVSDAAIMPLIAETVDTTNPREWYYALMDYGAYIKKQFPNPSRNSTTYAKQSRFSGSLREARGAVLRCLSRGQPLTPAHIARQETIDMARLLTAIEQLKKEGFIRQSGRLLTLAP
ncbi:MAG: A/G-specific adenine glycosylase [Treponema sp.]|nr:A/G-specific adenine glycosylase [Treponema sp.]